MLRHYLSLTAALSAAAPALAQYCAPDVFTLGVEPICHVIFADLDHTSPSEGTAPAYEDFTALVAHVAPGVTYTVSVQGNTAGTPPNYIAANFDWDGDQLFETHVELGQLNGGNCDTEMTGEFTVPADAVIGTSRVRFVKTFSYSADDDGCAWFSSYGQAEDYTIDVSTTAGIVDLNAVPLGLFPNPNDGDFHLTNTGDSPNVEVRIMDVAGRTVHVERTVIAPGTAQPLSLSSYLSPGTYSALIASGTVTSVGRFIVR